jgi:hypothetical protein
MRVSISRYASNLRKAFGVKRGRERGLLRFETEAGAALLTPMNRP